MSTQTLVDVPVAAPATSSEQALVARLRAGDETAFTDLVQRWSRAMLHVARGHVSTDASAAEVVQETWLAVIRGLPAFEARSSLRTWVFRILVNTAKTRGVKESRVTPLSSLSDDPAVGEDSDHAPGRSTPPGAPQRWHGDPVRGALRVEVRELLLCALDALPARQRSVVVLRDVHGCEASEVCDLLGLTSQNQRVLLHRGRAKVRGALESYYRGEA